MNTICKLLMLALLVSFPLRGEAQEQKEPEIGTGLICNTAEQVETVVALTKENRSLQQTLLVVNARAAGDKNVCTVASISYKRGKTVKAGIRSTDGVRDIVEITVVGIPIGRMQGVIIVQELPEPLTQYTLFVSKGEEV